MTDVSRVLRFEEAAVRSVHAWKQSKVFRNQKEISFEPFLPPPTHITFSTQMSSLPNLRVKLPAAELLSLASRALGALQQKQLKLHNELEAQDKEDERAEMMESLNDTGLVYSVIDPEAFYSEKKKTFGE